MVKNRFRGSCLCGKVAYEIEGPFKVFQYCHCSRCRKFTGSAHAANLFVPPEHFRWISGQEYVERYELPGAKYFATTFCRQCGSSLPWTAKGGTNVIVTAGTLDEDPGIRPMWNIFWSDRAPWYTGCQDLPVYEKYPDP